MSILFIQCVRVQSYAFWMHIAFLPVAYFCVQTDYVFIALFFSITNLNKADKNNKLHDLLSSIFPCTTTTMNGTPMWWPGPGYRGDEGSQCSLQQVIIDD